MLWHNVAKVKYFTISVHKIIITHFVSISDVCVQAFQMLIFQMQIVGGMLGENCIIKVMQQSHHFSASAVQQCHEGCEWCNREFICCSNVNNHPFKCLALHFLVCKHIPSTNWVLSLVYFGPQIWLVC